MEGHHAKISIISIIVILIVGAALYFTSHPDEEYGGDLISALSPLENQDWSVEELYQAFQENKDEAMDLYGGEHLTVEGYVSEIIGTSRPTGLVLISNNSDQKLVSVIYMSFEDSARMISMRGKILLCMEKLGKTSHRIGSLLIIVNLSAIKHS